MIRETAARLAAGELTVSDALERCLERIAAREPEVRAWTAISPGRARELAGALETVQPGGRGPLHGIPLGIKDIFDTHDLPTEYGSPIYAGHHPAADASVVALARAAGMLVLGKLATTEFAAWPPAPTRNPHDPSRTPGGSSAGSAAAVAAGMVPLALATQTTGSIIRPAAFCGVVGYKPSHGMLPCVGVKAISESFDTVGVMATCVGDAALLVETLSGRPLDVSAAGPPRIGICRTPEWPAAQPETVALFASLTERVRAGGAEACEVELPGPFAALVAAQHTVWSYEIARCLADEHLRFRQRIREPLRSMLDEGRELPYDRYCQARQAIAACHAELAAVFAEVDVLLTPSAPGEAPPLETTGDPVFNRGWSALGVPVINVPAGRGPRGLPLGLQVVGPPAGDARALSAAAWLEALLA